MDAKIKDIWVKALRSGLFRQGKGRLHKESRGKQYYCCLGVLQEAAIGVQGPRDKGGVGVLNKKEMLKAGLTFENCCVLARMNDGIYDKPRSTFNQIADWIEKNL